MMTKSERNRNTRRVLLVSLGVSGAAHVAALLWLALPVRTLEVPAKSLAVLAPVSAAVFLEAPEVVKPPSADAEPSGGGETGAASARETVISKPAARRSTATAAAGDPLMVAQADTVSALVAEAVPAAAMAVAKGRHAASEDVKAEETALTQVATAQPAQHTPGSAARAKNGGAGSSPGSMGSGAGDFGPGITIKAGPKRHPKRHPPRGIPGRRW